MSDLLSLAGVTAGYGATMVLRDVSLSVGAGEVVALLGRNGVGKTTLLRAAAGFVQPSAGTVFLDGQPLAGAPPYRIARRAVCYVAQEQALFAAEGIPVDARDPVALVLFPEMDAAVDVPEISEGCWGILGRTPDSVMCSSSRMVVRRRGADGPSVVACTLLPYETEFDLGATLREASRPVALNHPHCARFCVLGGAACSR